MKKLITTIIIAIIVGFSYSYAQEGEAELMLRSSVSEATKGEEFSVDVVLKNPGRQAVISVRSWLNYDPAALEVLNINTSNSPFGLSAPGEDTFSVEEGRVKVGRSNITGGVSTPEATVATISFKVLASNATQATLGFYDYQVSELGHTSVNIIDSGFPVNILSKAPESIRVSLNPGAVAPPVVQPPIVVEPVQPIGGPPLATVLVRPVNLKANTGNGYVDLKWDSTPDLARVGYNIYYGRTSGQYTRRKPIGDFDNFRLLGLNNNETYFLAVTSYDQFNRESDYSNEVGIIVNQPLSSTHPFESILQQAVAVIPVQPQNGPLVGWLLFSAAGLGATVVFRRKKVVVSS